MERVDGVGCERLILVSYRQLCRVIVKGHVAITVVDDQGQVKGGIEMVVCEIIVVNIGILDRDGNMSRANDEPYYEDAQA